MTGVKKSIIFVSQNTNHLNNSHMKKVVNPETVAHLWANKVQDEARTANSNFYFDGDSIYSYGRHFTIAKHVTNADGANAVLFSTRSYSNSTSKHQSTTRYAANHLNKIFVPDAGEGQTHNFNRWLSEIKGEATNLQRARKPEKYITAIQQIYHSVEIYASFFGYEIPTELQIAGNITTYAQYEALTQVEREAKAERERLAEIDRKIQAIEQAKKFKKVLTKWRKFDKTAPAAIYSGLHDGFSFLRYNADKNRVETSQRVEIPAEIAKRFYKTVLEVIERGGCTDCNMTFMEHYKVIEINKDFIRVGCHKIEIKEIKALTDKLGW